MDIIAPVILIILLVGGKLGIILLLADIMNRRE